MAVLSRGANLFAYRLSSATRVIKLCIVARIEWLILWKMIMKMLTHIHMVVYTWWCWHIYKGDEVGVDVDQLMKWRREGFETPPADCPPVECGQSDSATSALYRKDRVS